MTRRDYHFHHHFDSNDRPKKKCGGFFMTTIKGLAKKFDVSNKAIIIGFIIFFLINWFFAAVTFFVAYHWVKNPGKVEDVVDGVIEKGRRGFKNFTSRTEAEEATYASEQGGHHAHYERDDFDFSDLKSKFDDLEKRTNGMEEHVSSEEHKLNKEFNDLKGK